MYGPTDRQTTRLLELLCAAKKLLKLSKACTKFVIKWKGSTALSPGMADPVHNVPRHSHLQPTSWLHLSSLCTLQTQGRLSRKADSGQSNPFLSLFATSGGPSPRHMVKRRSDDGCGNFRSSLKLPAPQGCATLTRIRIFGPQCSESNFARGHPHQK